LCGVFIATTWATPRRVASKNKPDANESQLAEIARLTSSDGRSPTRGLGTWQAEALIARLRAEKREFADLVLARAREEQGRRNFRSAEFFLLALGIIALLAYYLH